MASSMLLWVGFDELHERKRTSVCVAGPIGRRFCSGWETPLCRSAEGGSWLSPGQAAGRGQAGTACKPRHGCEIWLNPDLHATPTGSIWREEEQKALPAQGSPCCAQRHSRGGLNAMRVRCKLLLPLTSLQQVPDPSLSLRRKSPGRPVTQPSDQAFPRQIAPCLLLLLLLLPLPPVSLLFQGCPAAGSLFPCI